MKYLTIILILGVLLVLSACGSPAVSDGDQDMTDTDVTPTDDVADADEEESMLTSIGNLMKMGKAYHCSYNGDMGGVKSEQDVYIDGDKYRVDMTIVTSDGTQTSNMINDGNYIYSWGSTTPQGMKMSLEFLEEQGSEDDFSIDTNEEYGYACDSWRAQNSKFDPPSDVEFIDFGDLMAGLGDAFGDY